MFVDKVIRIKARKVCGLLREMQCVALSPLAIVSLSMYVCMLKPCVILVYLRKTVWDQSAIFHHLLYVLGHEKPSNDIVAYDLDLFFESQTFK